MATTPALRSMLATITSWALATLIGITGIVYHRELGAAASRALGLRPIEIAAPSAEHSQQATGQRKREGDRAVELRAGRNGHFFAEAEINGRRIDVMIDSGASIVALTWEDALTAGVSPRESDFTHRVSTANGTARVAPVMLSRIQIGEVMIRNVEAAVAEPGKLNITLVGNSFLGRLSRYEMRSGRLVLEE